MSQSISTAEVRKNLADIVNRVSYGKEAVILTRRGKEVAAIVGIDELRLLQAIENKIDIEDAKKILLEAGDNISAKEVWSQLGL